MPFVAGIDSSTSATKAEVRDLHSGTVVWRGSNPHPMTAPPRSEQDPQDWWRALRPLLDGAWSATGTAGIAAVSVAAQQHGMVLLGADRQVLRPAKLWNDTEAADDARGLLGALGGPAGWARATGSVPGPAFTIAKLAWLRRVEPAVHAHVVRVLLPHDWLTMQLSGEIVTDCGDASGTGYFSPATSRWLPEALGLVGLDEAVTPRLVEPFSAVASVRGLTVAGGTGDNMAAALGVGLGAGELALSFGTSGTAFARSDRPVADPTGAVAGFADAAGGYLPLVCTLNATRVLETVARLLGTEVDGLDALALEASARRGDGNPVLVPYFDGERTPDLPHATGTLFGLRSTTDRADLARAAVAGVVCALLDGADALTAAGVPAPTGRVVLMGGGGRSAAVRRMVADLLGRPVSVPAEDQPVAAGACVQAASVATGAPPEQIQHAWGLGAGTLVEPDRSVDAGAVREAYRAARRRACPES
jgi:xylulokinase